MAISDEKKMKKAETLANLVYVLFKVLKPMTMIRNVNYPKQQKYPLIFASWHAHQCAFHGLENRDITSILISKSVDGEIIAQVVEKWGFKTVRGSKGKKGSVESTLSMITRLKSGENIAITVDGPKGPAHIVKKGVIMVAKNSGAPIIPMTWYSPSPTLLNLPSWDNFRIPAFFTPLVNLYGEPIYVNADNTDEQDEEIRIKLENAIKELDERAPKAWKEAWGLNLWKKKN